MDKEMTQDVLDAIGDAQLAAKACERTGTVEGRLQVMESCDWKFLRLQLTKLQALAEQFVKQHGGHNA